LLRRRDNLAGHQNGLPIEALKIEGGSKLQFVAIKQMRNFVFVCISFRLIGRGNLSPASQASKQGIDASAGSEDLCGF